MESISVQEAQSRLAEIIDSLPPGEEIVITRDDKPVATIRGAVDAARPSRQLGSLKGSILYMAPDFDEIPEGFEDYVD